MRITVEFSETEVKEICRLTGEAKNGPAIRKLVADSLLLKRREELAQKFIEGEWGNELQGLEANQAADRNRDKRIEKRWRK